MTSTDELSRPEPHRQSLDDSANFFLSACPYYFLTETQKHGMNICVKKTILLLSIIALAGCASSSDSKLRADTTNEQTLQVSMRAMAMELDEQKRSIFMQSMAYGADRTYREVKAAMPNASDATIRKVTFRELDKMLNGKTAKEIMQMFEQ